MVWMKVVFPTVSENKKVTIQIFHIASIYVDYTILKADKDYLHLFSFAQPGFFKQLMAFIDNEP